jgi:hypothetical protein
MLSEPAVLGLRPSNSKHARLVGAWPREAGRPACFLFPSPCFSKPDGLARMRCAICWRGRKKETQSTTRSFRNSSTGSILKIVEAQDAGHDGLRC